MSLHSKLCYRVHSLHHKMLSAAKWTSHLVGTREQYVRTIYRTIATQASPQDRSCDKLTRCRRQVHKQHCQTDGLYGWLETY